LIIAAGFAYYLAHQDIKAKRRKVAIENTMNNSIEDFLPNTVTFEERLAHYEEQRKRQGRNKNLRQRIKYSLTTL